MCVIKKETVKDYTYENTEKDGSSKTTRQHGYSYPKNSGMVFVSDANSTSVKECRYTKETPSSIKVISDKGKKVFDKTFEGEKQWNNVRDGGFLVLTDQNWTYITPEGKEKTELSAKTPMLQTLQALHSSLVKKFIFRQTAAESSRSM